MQSLAIDQTSYAIGRSLKVAIHSFPEYVSRTNLARLELLQIAFPVVFPVVLLFVDYRTEGAETRQWWPSQQNSRTTPSYRFQLPRPLHATRPKQHELHPERSVYSAGKTRKFPSNQWRQQCHIHGD